MNSCEVGSSNIAHIIQRKEQAINRFCFLLKWSENFEMYCHLYINKKFYFNFNFVNALHSITD